MSKERVAPASCRLSGGRPRPPQRIQLINYSAGSSGGSSSSKSPHFGQQLVGPVRLLLIDLADSKAHVHQNVIAQYRFGDEVQTYLAHNAAKLHPTGPSEAQILFAKNFPRDGETHRLAPEATLHLNNLIAPSDTSGSDSRH